MENVSKRTTSSTTVLPTSGQLAQVLGQPGDILVGDSPQTSYLVGLLDWQRAFPQ